MASTVREILIDAPVADVWDAITDFEGCPVRVGGDLIVASTLATPDTRTLTFADGTRAQERLIARDDDARRMVWAWIGPEVVHDNTSMQVFDAGDGKSRVVWIHDTLPDHLAGWLGSAMDALVPAMQAAFAR